LNSDYGDADEPISVLGTEPLDQGVDEDEALGEDPPHPDELDQRRILAAQRAWELWVGEDESEETQARQEAVITQSLLGRALPTLGAAGNDGPIENLSELLRYEPALAPPTNRIHERLRD